MTNHEIPAPEGGLSDPAILKEAADRYRSSTSAQAFVNGALFARAALAAQPQQSDAQRAKSALADLELIPEDRAPLEAIVAAGYRHARGLKDGARPSPAEGDAAQGPSEKEVLRLATERVHQQFSDLLSYYTDPESGHVEHEAEEDEELTRLGRLLGRLEVMKEAASQDQPKGTEPAAVEQLLSTLFDVLEGNTMPGSVRKQLEAAYWQARAAVPSPAVKAEPHGWVVWWPKPGGGHSTLFSHGPEKPSYGPELDALLRHYPVYEAPQPNSLVPVQGSEA